MNLSSIVLLLTILIISAQAVRFDYLLREEYLAVPPPGKLLSNALAATVLVTALVAFLAGRLTGSAPLWLLLIFHLLGPDVVLEGDVLHFVNRMQSVLCVATLPVIIYLLYEVAAGGPPPAPKETAAEPDKPDSPYNLRKKRKKTYRK